MAVSPGSLAPDGFGFEFRESVVGSSYSSQNLVARVPASGYFGFESGSQF